MPRRKRATLGSVWWKQVIARVKYCHVCSGALARKYVREERSWRRVCVSCGSISYFNPKVVAGTIPVMGGKVILGRRAIEPAQGRWGFPCGYVELGESAEEGAVRETWEEIGLRVKTISLLGVYSYADAGVVTVVYIAQAGLKDKPKPLLETTEVKAFAIREIPWEKLAFRSTRHALEDWVRSTRR